MIKKFILCVFLYPAFTYSAHPGSTFTSILKFVNQHPYLITLPVIPLAFSQIKQLDEHGNVIKPLDWQQFKAMDGNLKVMTATAVLISWLAAGTIMQLVSKTVLDYYH